MIEYKFKWIRQTKDLTEVQAVINEGEFATGISRDPIEGEREITYFRRDRVLATPFFRFKGTMTTDEIRKWMDNELVKVKKEPIPIQKSVLRTEELTKYVLL